MYMNKYRDMERLWTWLRDYNQSKCCWHVVKPIFFGPLLFRWLAMHGEVEPRVFTRTRQWCWCKPPDLLERSCECCLVWKLFLHPWRDPVELADKLLLATLLHDVQWAQAWPWLAGSFLAFGDLQKLVDLGRSRSALCCLLANRPGRWQLGVQAILAWGAPDGISLFND